MASHSPLHSITARAQANDSPATRVMRCLYSIQVFARIGARRLIISSAADSTAQEIKLFQILFGGHAIGQALAQAFCLSLRIAHSAEQAQETGVRLR